MYLIPDAWAAVWLLAVDLISVVHVEAEKVDQLTRCVDLGLVHVLALSPAWSLHLAYDAMALQSDQPPAEKQLHGQSSPFQPTRPLLQQLP